jgi:hypothetical protein
MVPDGVEICRLQNIKTKEHTMAPTPLRTDEAV